MIVVWGGGLRRRRLPWSWSTQVDAVLIDRFGFRVCENGGKKDTAKMAGTNR